MEDPVDEMDPQSHSGLNIKNRRKKFMKRKQLAALAAATVMALSLVGCGGGSSTSTETKAAEAGATTAAVAETDKKADDGELIKKVAHVCQGLGDKSFSDSLEGGMKVLREKGWDCKTVECGDETKACSTPRSCTTVKSFSDGIWSITVPFFRAATCNACLFSLIIKYRF